MYTGMAVSSRSCMHSAREAMRTARKATRAYLFSHLGCVLMRDLLGIALSLARRLKDDGVVDFARNTDMGVTNPVLCETNEAKSYSLTKRAIMLRRSSPGLKSLWTHVLHV